MTTPTLAELLRWLSEMPVAFRAEPEGFPGGVVRTRAVVSDLFESLFGEAPDSALLGAFEPSDAGAGAGAGERNRLRYTLAAAHLLWHPSFRGGTVSRSAVQQLLVQELATVASIVDRDQLDQDAERREELIRRTLRAVAWLLPGETQNEAEDRLKQVDSIERRRVLLGAAERERRAREVREAMAKKAAEEAAAKVSRE